jgi:hypothetical protein
MRRDRDENNSNDGDVSPAVVERPCAAVRQSARPAAAAAAVHVPPPPRQREQRAPHAVFTQPAVLARIIEFAVRAQEDITLLHVGSAWEDAAVHDCGRLWTRLVGPHVVVHWAACHACHKWRVLGLLGVRRGNPYSTRAFKCELLADGTTCARPCEGGLGDADVMRLFFWRRAVRTLKGYA